MRVPDGPHLRDEERPPADEVADDDGQRQLHRLHLGARDAAHVRARRRRRRPAAFAVGRQMALEQAAVGGAPLVALRRLAWRHALPDDVADASVRGGERERRNDVDGDGDPGDVELERPRRLEDGPAVATARRRLAEREDRQLRRRHDERNEPGAGDQRVHLGRRPGVWRERVADGEVAVDGRRDEHVRRRVHRHYLNARAVLCIFSAEPVHEYILQRFTCWLTYTHMAPLHHNKVNKLNINT